MLDFSTYPPLLRPEDLPSALAGTDSTIVEAVGEAIRGYCGWHVAPKVTETITIDHRGRRIVTLPTLHVDAITAVIDRDGNPVEGFDWSTSGFMERDCWPTGLQSLKVTLTHGLEAVPAAIIRVAVDMITDQQSSDAGPSIGNVQLDGARIDYAVPSSDVGVRRRMSYAYGHILGRYRL